MSEGSQDQWVILIEVNNSTQADLVRSILQGSDIDSYIPQEAFGLTYGGVLGLKILVRQEDLARAKEVLSGEGYLLD